jgi:hypothetical protein
MKAPDLEQIISEEENKHTSFEGRDRLAGLLIIYLELQHYHQPTIDAHTLLGYGGPVTEHTLNFCLEIYKTYLEVCPDKISYLPSPAVGGGSIAYFDTKCLRQLVYRLLQQERQKYPS